MFFRDEKKNSTKSTNNLYFNATKNDVNRNHTDIHRRTQWSLNTLLHIVQVYVLANKMNTMTMMTTVMKKKNITTNNKNK